MMGVERDSESVPVFVPPRKRQTTKKVNGVQNYVDHIVSVQVRDWNKSFLRFESIKLRFRSQPPNRQYPLSSSLEDLLTKTNQATSEKQHAYPTAMKSVSKNSIDKLAKKSSSREISLFLDDSTKYRSTDSKSTYRTSPSVNDDSENIDMNRARSVDGDGLTMRQFKKRVNILTSTDQPQSKQNLCSSSISFENDLDAIVDGRQVNTFHSKSHTRSNSPNQLNEKYLTMTGTIKRGRQKGQSIDLKLNISREELEHINTTALMMQHEYDNNAAENKSCCACSLTSGMHIVLLSLISLPFVVLVTIVYAFYVGTITWYNMFTYFNEEKTYLHKLIMSPLLVVTYPVAILLCTIGLGIYSGIVQISTKFSKWSNEVADIEKGFYGWLCSFLHLSDCSPYEVIILTDLKVPDEATTAPAHTSTEELSL